MAEPAESETPEVESERVAEPSEVRPPLRSVELRSAVLSHGTAAAEKAISGVKNGIERAKRSLDKRNKDWERAAASARLPSVEKHEPMADLATRQDGEATFWRSFAMRTMKPGIAQLLAIVSGAVGLFGGLSLASLAGLRGLLGDGASAPQLWAGAGALATGVACGIAAAWWIHRTSQRSIAEALMRADGAERRLIRTAAILALRHADETAYKEALIRLERG